jgi:glutamine amidotransferase
MLVIVDYGMGNLGSIKNMIKKIGHECKISQDPDVILNATKLILPGVGSFDQGMANLQSLNLIGPLTQKVIEDKIPTMGICLGMQLLTQKSEEGVRPGLGWIEAEVIKFEDLELKVPHMGWNVAKPEKESLLFSNDGTEQRFYFVHSFRVICKNEEDVLTATQYGNKFVSSFSRDNIYGVQYHPEKSHLFGMNLLKRFMEL